MKKKEGKYEFYIEKNIFIHFYNTNGSEEEVEIGLSWYSGLGGTNTIKLDFVPSVGLKLSLPNSFNLQTVKEVSIGFDDNGDHTNNYGNRIIIEDEHYWEKNIMCGRSEFNSFEELFEFIEVYDFDGFNRSGWTIEEMKNEIFMKKKGIYEDWLEGKV